jgi:aspartyl protease family protein
MRRIVLAVCCAAALADSAQAQFGPQPAAAAGPTLMPNIGETVEEFEARRQGLPRPLPRNAQATLKADRQGHFFAEATINGERVRALVDTGATFVALSEADASRLGLKVRREDFTYRMSTANGVVAAAPVHLAEVQVGEVTLRDVQAVIHREGGPPVTLLGMSFLGRLGALQTAAGRLVLRQ